MTIVRWSPFPEIEAFDRRICRMLDEVGIAPAAIPAADVYETDKEFTFELEVPGFEENELSIEVNDHTLVVKGEQLETKDEKDKQYRLHERLEKTFERRFTLPLDVDTTKHRRRVQQGRADRYAPKVDVPKPRKVAIAAKNTQDWDSRGRSFGAASGRTPFAPGDLTDAPSMNIPAPPACHTGGGVRVPSLPSRSHAE